MPLRRPFISLLLTGLVAHGVPRAKLRVYPAARPSPEPTAISRRAFPEKARAAGRGPPHTAGMRCPQFLRRWHFTAAEATPAPASLATDGGTAFLRQSTHPAGSARGHSLSRARSPVQGPRERGDKLVERASGCQISQSHSSLKSYTEYWGPGWLG